MKISKPADTRAPARPSCARVPRSVAAYPAAARGRPGIGWLVGCLGLRGWLDDAAQRSKIGRMNSCKSASKSFGQPY